MSPTEIPGEALKFLTNTGQQNCKKCKRNYQTTKLSESQGIIYMRCPHCNYIINTYELKTVLRMARQAKLAKGKSAK